MYTYGGKDANRKATYNVAHINDVARLLNPDENNEDSNDNTTAQLHILSWSLGQISQKSC